jgi:hypothetical protein
MKYLPSHILKPVYCLLFILFFLGSSAKASQENYLVRCNQKLVDVIMEDLFSPAVASRVKVYPNVAAYEILCLKGGGLHSFQGKLTGLGPIPKPSQKVDFSLSALFAFSTVAKKLVYSEYIFDAFEEKEKKIWKSTHKKDSSLLNPSKEYGMEVAQFIIAWMKKDNYDYTRTLSRYVLSDSAGAWIPTGPGYANALEPNWGLMRSLIFDSTNMIKAIPNFPYSEDKNSAFYKNAMEVYNQSQNLDTAKRLTAWYWDDNPNILKSEGHVNYFIHKVSPCGHWVRIAAQAVKNRGLDEFKTTEVFTILSIGIFEAFIGCWKEKYTSNSLRPETYINRVISPQWKSYIETPPFPEYTSGHSVTSSTSATILTELIPQPYAFIDSSEMYINLPARKFKSFREAADQASISRFYGGIHFMPALNNGVIQGKEIGQFIIRKLKSK